MVCNSISVHSGPQGQGDKCMKKFAILCTVVLKGKGTNVYKNVQFCAQWSLRARGQMCKKMCKAHF